MECDALSSLEFYEFNQRLREHPIPLSGTLELTHRCNLGCVHCYCRRPATDRAASAAEMGLDTIRRIVDEIVQAGCLYLTLTGGEPLVRKDFLEIYDHVRDKGILVTLFTNGTLITRQLADYLEKRPPLKVEISLYGATEGTYERITGVPGSYRQCRRGISLLLERGISVAVKTPAMTLNKDEIASLQDLAAEMGCPFYYDLMLHPRLNTMEDRMGPYSFGLSVDEKLRMTVSDRATLDAWQAEYLRLKGVPRQRTRYKCGAGLHAFFVEPAGSLVMCVNSRWPAYDLASGTFEEGWAFLRALRAELAPADDPCAGCEIYWLCRSCVGRSQLEYGPQERDEPVEWHCQLAHERYNAFVELGMIPASEDPHLSTESHRSRELEEK